MKFLLSIYGNDEVWSSLPPEELTELIRATDAHNREMTDAGELLFACGVAEPVNARRVHRDETGSTLVSDGPYIETKEFLGSFYIVDCDSLERALELAAGMPSAALTDIEVKQIIHGGTTDDL